MTALKQKITRRQFLVVSLVSGVGLTAALQLPMCGGNKNQTIFPRRRTNGLSPNAWITIHEDNKVTVMVNHSEMGQGIVTALPMIAAEELDADWEDVRFEIAPVAEVYKNPMFKMQWTVSSRSVESSWDILRKAGAAVRQLFVNAAAETWGVSPDICRTEKGHVIHTLAGKSLRYADLLDTAVSLPVPENPRLKTAGEFRIIGKTIRRLDGWGKITGAAKFGTDVRLPGMLTAIVIHPPVFGSRFVSINRNELLNMPGVKAVVPVRTGVAVVADTFWRAFQAYESVDAKWSREDAKEMNSDLYFKRWKALAARPGKTMFETGNVTAVNEDQGRVLEAAYDLPYQAHATPEPMNCTAHVQNGGCEIWAPTQNQQGACEIAAEITGLSRKRITVHTTYLGGGFGRRASVDYVGEAVELSQALSKPVKVLWPREEDIGNDRYRAGTHNRMRAVVDDRGIPVAWNHRIAGSDVFTQLIPEIVGAMLPDWMPLFVRKTARSAAKFIVPRFVAGKKAILGAGPLPYLLSNMRVEFINDDPGIPLGWWRSVAHSTNCFAVESFIDEIAAAVGRDPLDLRCELLATSPRLLNVLKTAAEKTPWDTPPKPDIYRGVACHEFQETMMALIAEVSISEKNEIRVHRVVCALDCGVAINPGNIAAQVQSGVCFGLTATIKSGVTIRNGAVQESNFDDFPLLRFDEMPQVETHIIQSDRPPTGIGEVAVPLVAPAVTNAIFAARGIRIRKLPVFSEDIVSGSPVPVS